MVSVSARLVVKWQPSLYLRSGGGRTRQQGVIDSFLDELEALLLKGKEELYSHGEGHFLRGKHPKKSKVLVLEVGW